MDNSGRVEGHQDKSVIRGYLRGDPDASVRIDFWIFSVIRNPRWGFGSDLEDMHQRVRLRLLMCLKNFEGRSSLKTYVCRVAIYTCTDEVRRRRRLKEHLSLDDTWDIPDQGPTALDLIEADERRRLLSKLVSMATPECRDLWKMIYLDEMPFGRIAKTVGVRPGTIKSRAARCREKARLALKSLLKVRNLGGTDTTV